MTVRPIAAWLLLGGVVYFISTIIAAAPGAYQ